MTRALRPLGDEQRRCRSCGQLQQQTPPDWNQCDLCGGELETSVSVWL